MSVNPISKAKAVVDDRIDRILMSITAKTMESYLPRWRELSEVETDEEIDWELPCVQIESLLCDPRNLKLIRCNEHTDVFLAKLTTD